MKALAVGYGARVTRYTGKKLLFDRIFEQLTTTPDRQHDLAAWFAYRVYREMVGGEKGADITGPAHPVIQDAAQRLASQPDVMKSIRRYQGRDLIWFGEWTSPEGVVHQGGSNRTIAYKAATEFLRTAVSKERSRQVAVPERHYESRATPANQRVEPAAAKGCLTVMLLGVGLVAILSTAAASILMR